MKDQKKQMIDENEKSYGAEIRQKFGDAVINQSNQKMDSMTQEQHQQIQKMAEEIISGVETAVRTGELPQEEEGRRLAKLHQRWLGFTWPVYSKEAHLKLVDAYVEDPRFRQYYDRKIDGCAEFLRAAVKAYLQ